MISIPSTTGALTTAVSLKFNLKGKQEELNKTIGKIVYVVSCNGDFTEVEYKQIFNELKPTNT
jgi:hypothetical protein